MLSLKGCVVDMTEAESVNDVVFSQSQIVSEETIFPTSVTNAGASNCNTRMQSGAIELGRRLLLAARAGDTSLVLDLMAKGAPFTNDWLGTSPLHLAASNAHVETCGVLLRAGVSRESRTKVDRTPLHLAAYAGHAEVVELLLQHGAQVDCRDMLRMTPLHWAAERGHAAVVAALLRRGAELRPVSKFRKTPAQLAAARRHQHVLALLDEEAKLREAAKSVRALVSERPAEETAASEPQRAAGLFTTVQRNVQEVKIKTKPVQEKTPKLTEIKGEKIEGGGGGRSGAAAALLRRHGITLLPADDTTTVLSALQSGRTVVLSDAGKLMLKESEEPTSAANSNASSVVTPASVSVTTAGSGGKASRGMVLTATPVRATPLGVKVFTVNNRTSVTPAEARPRAKIMTPQDLQHVKIVQLPANARIVSPRKAPRRLRVAPAPASIPTTGIPTTGGARAPVKIIMNKANFERLVSTPDVQPVPVSTPTVLAQEFVLPETTPSAATTTSTCVDSSDDVTVLKALLAQAQKTITSLTEELQDCRERLARYEQSE
ncbi:hypothetical protein ABMA27_000618 [Loxostege sticticalis]|uniref:Uncharacterized protein n=1 Tax=Loxostege sticticalis TaxID=481309 RepID=A0ABR3HZN6_LOXSC